MRVSARRILTRIPEGHKFVLRIPKALLIIIPGTRSRIDDQTWPGLSMSRLKRRTRRELHSDTIKASFGAENETQLRLRNFQVSRIFILDEAAQICI